MGTAQIKISSEVYPTNEINTPEKIKRVFDFLAFQENTCPTDIAIANKVNGQWQKYSTQDFRKEANLVSLALLAMGLKKGDTVGIISENRPEWNFVDVGAIQIGCVVVPLYPNASSNDFLYILAHAEVKVLFVSQKDIYDKVLKVTPSLPDLKVFTFENITGADNFASFRLKAKNQDERILESYRLAVEAQDLMTLMYTSGTTGTPKGVMISHDNLVFNILSLSTLNLLDNTAQGELKVLSFLPLCHVFEKSVFYFYLLKGAHVYYAESMEKIAENIKEVCPKGFTTVPRLLEKVYEKIEAKGNELTGLKKWIFRWAMRLAKRFKPEEEPKGWYGLQLKWARKLVFSKWQAALGGNIAYIFSSASALQPRLAKVFWAAGIPVMEGYGASECTPGLSSNFFGEDNYLVGSVGKVIPNIEVRIIQEEGYQKGEGEIVCRGRNVMQGYYKKPDITAETIIDGWLHTGDIGRFVDKKGNPIELDSDQIITHQDAYFLKITDRKKEVFKTSGGKYIAPLQLETKFKESHFIEQMAVVGEYQKFPAALIVPSFENLKTWCIENNISSVLPSEMVKHPEVIQLYESIVAHYNEFFGQVERIKKFALLDREWTVESNELTPTMKMKRRVIQANFKDVIESFYKDESSR